MFVVVLLFRGAFRYSFFFFRRGAPSAHLRLQIAQ